METWDIENNLKSLVHGFNYLKYENEGIRDKLDTDDYDIYYEELRDEFIKNTQSNFFMFYMVMLLLKNKNINLEQCINIIKGDFDPILFESGV